MNTDGGGTADIARPVEPVKEGSDHKFDSIQQILADFASSLHYEAIPDEVAHQAKVRLIDTLGALIAGFGCESAVLARDLSPLVQGPRSATIIGTGDRTTVEMAAFANSVAARSAEMMDVYHFPGSFGGHPSDVVMPIFAAAEQADVTGAQLISGIVLAYEIFLRFSDAFHNPGFDDTNFASVATAVGAAHLWTLSHAQIAHGIAIAAVTNLALKQVRMDELTAWKVLATGQAGRAGIFAATLARGGAPGPSRPFEGRAGWIAHVARAPFALDAMGDATTQFKILNTRIKSRPAAGETISTIIASEKFVPLLNVEEIEEVVIELYRRALDRAGCGEHHWRPSSEHAAGNSIPYVAAVALSDGTITRRSFDEVHRGDPRIRELMTKVSLRENHEFTAAYDKTPVEHRTRITVVMKDGTKHVAESGGDGDDLSAEKTDDQIEAKFRGSADKVLGPDRSSRLLDLLWGLERVSKVSPILRGLTWNGFEARR